MITVDQLKKLHSKIEAMSEEEREMLDPIAEALEEHRRKVREREGRGWMQIPNRLDALAAVEWSMAYERMDRDGPRATNQEAE